MAVVTSVPFIKIPHKSFPCVSHDTQMSITGEKKSTQILSIQVFTLGKALSCNAGFSKIRPVRALIVVKTFCGYRPCRPFLFLFQKSASIVGYKSV
jgi:hypothetical protein